MFFWGRHPLETCKKLETFVKKPGFTAETGAFNKKN